MLHIILASDCLWKEEYGSSSPGDAGTTEEETSLDVELWEIYP